MIKYLSMKIQKIQQIPFNEKLNCGSVLLLLLLLLSRFSHVRLCVTPSTSAHQAPPSLGFSRQEHWSGLPFPSPRCLNTLCSMFTIYCYCLVAKLCVTLLQTHGLQLTRLLCLYDFPGKNIGMGCHFLLQGSSQPRDRTHVSCTAGKFFTAESPGKPHIYYSTF